MKKYIVRLLFLLFAFGHNNQSLISQVSQPEFEALVALYNSTDGDNWINNSGWNINGTANQVDDSWFGITVNNGHVDQIDLTINGLGGQIPEEIGNLIHLKILQLSINEIAGVIPDEIGNLVELEYLDLHRNNLSGTIPSRITELTSLKGIRLSNNMLSGSIPEEIGSLTMLESLDIHANQLTGNIPADIGELKSLKHLNLLRNKLTGTIPPEIGDLSNLESLSLFTNELSGAVPDEISSLIRLERLYLNDNHFDYLPDISNLLQLRDLWIMDNRFHFDAIEPHIDLALEEFMYAPQAKVGEVDEYYLPFGEEFTFSVDVRGENNTYQWYKDDEPIVGATNTSYFIESITHNDAGIYVCRINNTIVPGLTLVSEDITLNVFSVQPLVVTQAPWNITANSAMTGGEVTSDGGATVTERGILWGTDPDPVTTGAQVPLGDGLGAFSTAIDALDPVTTYYVVAYANNSEGTAYGDIKQFTTLGQLPVVITQDPWDITANSAMTGGEVTSDGGATVTERGILWGTDPDPVTTGAQVPLGDGLGAFSTAIDALDPVTTYYVVAYANNSEGTAYGDIKQFTTDTEYGSVFIPNAFMPSSNLLDNQTFKPRFGTVPTEYSLAIFNRWGSQIFYTEDAQIGWDGKTNNGDAPQGTYSYMIKYIDENNTMQEKYGVVLLIR